MKFATGLILAAVAVTEATAGNSEYLRSKDSDTLNAGNNFPSSSKNENTTDNDDSNKLPHLDAAFVDNLSKLNVSEFKHLLTSMIEGDGSGLSDDELLDALKNIYDDEDDGPQTHYSSNKKVSLTDLNPSSSVRSQYESTTTTKDSSSPIQSNPSYSDADSDEEPSLSKRSTNDVNKNGMEYYNDIDDSEASPGTKSFSKSGKEGIESNSVGSTYNDPMYGTTGEDEDVPSQTSSKAWIDDSGSEEYPLTTKDNNPSKKYAYSDNPGSLDEVDLTSPLDPTSYPILDDQLPRRDVSPGSHKFRENLDHATKSIIDSPPTNAAYGSKSWLDDEDDDALTKNGKYDSVDDDDSLDATPYTATKPVFTKSSKGGIDNNSVGTTYNDTNYGTIGDDDDVATDKTSKAWIDDDASVNSPASPSYVSKSWLDDEDDDALTKNGKYDSVDDDDSLDATPYTAAKPVFTKSSKGGIDNNSVSTTYNDTNYGTIGDDDDVATDKTSKAWIDDDASVNSPASPSYVSKSWLDDEDDDALTKNGKYDSADDDDSLDVTPYTATKSASTKSSKGGIDNNSVGTTYNDTNYGTIGDDDDVATHKTLKAWIDDDASVNSPASPSYGSKSWLDDEDDDALTKNGKYDSADDDDSLDATPYTATKSAFTKSSKGGIDNNSVGTTYNDTNYGTIEDDDDVATDKTSKSWINDDAVVDPPNSPSKGFFVSKKSWYEEDDDVLAKNGRHDLNDDNDSIDVSPHAASKYVDAKASKTGIDNNSAGTSYENFADDKTDDAFASKTKMPKDEILYLDDNLQMDNKKSDAL
ncbi:hypothetical protein CCR75_007417 [Bremia lactucae]|uniref:Secreted protein n=1 Tax=Bremia lactucae TaxID=4779 RepID=A0A976NYV7_BRELC|nr:hypothetical protein CCR75_007417 [Bremia lactucae]